MLVRMHHAIVHGEVTRAIVPLVTQGHPNDPATARQIVHAARQEAIRQNHTNDNFLVAMVLADAGVNHLPVPIPNTSGPDLLNEDSHPKLFEATANPMGGNLVEIIKAIGAAVDLHTPDAMYRERVAIVSAFIKRMPLSATVKFGQATNAFTINGETVPDVLMRYDPTLEDNKWTVSPYARTIAPFIIQDTVSQPLPSIITKAHDLPLHPQNEA